MQKVISINEFEKTVNSIDDIEEPIIIKRENKEDLVVISLAEYKNGQVHSAESVFKELRDKYGY